MFLRPLTGPHSRIGRPDCSRTQARRCGAVETCRKRGAKREKARDDAVARRAQHRIQRMLGGRERVRISKDCMPRRSKEKSERDDDETKARRGRRATATLRGAVAPGCSSYRGLDRTFCAQHATQSKGSEVEQGRESSRSPSPLRSNSSGRLTGQTRQPDESDRTRQSLPAFHHVAPAQRRPSAPAPLPLLLASFPASPVLRPEAPSGHDDERSQAHVDGGAPRAEHGQARPPHRARAKGPAALARRQAL